MKYPLKVIQRHSFCNQLPAHKYKQYVAQRNRGRPLLERTGFAVCSYEWIGLSPISSQRGLQQQQVSRSLSVSMATISHFRFMIGGLVCGDVIS